MPVRLAFSESNSPEPCLYVLLICVYLYQNHLCENGTLPFDLTMSIAVLMYAPVILWFTLLQDSFHHWFSLASP